MNDGRLVVGRSGAFVRVTVVVDEVESKFLVCDLTPEEAKRMGQQLLQISQLIAETSYTVGSVH